MSHFPKYYKDTGCEYASSCLNCPFLKCVYEKSGGVYRPRKAERDKEVENETDSR